MNFIILVFTFKRRFVSPSSFPSWFTELQEEWAGGHTAQFTTNAGRTHHSYCGFFSTRDFTAFHRRYVYVKSIWELTRKCCTLAEVDASSANKNMQKIS